MKVIVTLVTKHDLTEADLERLVNPHKKEHPAQQVAKGTLAMALAEDVPPEVTEISVKAVEDGMVMAHRIWHPGQDADQ